MISLNFTLFLQLAVFLVFLWVLTGFLFKPILSILDERLDKTEGLRIKVAELEEEVRKKAREYKSRIEEARVEAIGVKSAQRKEGLGEERKILGAAIEKTRDIIEKKKEGIYKDAEQVRMEMEREAGEISRSIAGKVLGRRVK